MANAFKNFFDFFEEDLLPPEEQTDPAHRKQKESLDDEKDPAAQKSDGDDEPKHS